MTPVDLNLLNAVWRHMEGRVTYKLGAKAPNLWCDTSEIHEIDCSGFVRYAVARATKQLLILPDGSQAQLEWAQKNLKPVAYTIATVGNPESVLLYIAFLSPDPRADWPRHVWLVRQAYTRESCGSMGVGARPWNHPKLADPSGCYCLPSVK